MKIPISYQEGYAKASQVDPEFADKYLEHTAIGDPLADSLADALNQSDSKNLNNLLRSGLKGTLSANDLKSSPEALRNFLEFYNHIPDWVDLNLYNHGCRMFHRNTRLILAGMVGGVLVEGFATNIAQSFFLTGRVRDKGVRRLQQNNRHMLEIFVPRGLEMYNDGWVYSVRIRIVHAKIRRLLEESDDWDDEYLGMPISSANLGFAIASFSAQLVHHIKRLGASFSEEERESFLQVWRYSGYLMGIPESILFADEEEAKRLMNITRICEPPPSLESIAMASSLLNSAPLIAGINQSQDRKKLVKYILTISRALIGDKLADQLRYRNSPSWGVLWKFRLLNKIESLLRFIKNEKNQNLNTILSVSNYDGSIVNLKLPDHMYDEQSSDW